MFDFYETAAEAKKLRRSTGIQYWLGRARFASANANLTGAERAEAADQAAKIEDLLNPDPRPLGSSACDGYGPILG